MPAVRQAELIRRRELSPVELVESYLQRIEKLDGELNAFVTVVGDEAMSQARAAEQAATRGHDLAPFHGVPISIKDLSETKGIRTTFSCRAFRDYVPQIDSAIVRRMREAGFIIVGKTNTSEFGTIPVTESILNGQARNPWNPQRTPGGSSGGAASSVASGMIGLAQGQDGGGSIRIPSSCCGLFGLKPTRGRVSLAPRLGDAWEGASTDGPIARTVKDAAALLDVLAGYEVGDPYWAPPPDRPFVQEVGAPPGRLRVAFTHVTPTGIAPDSLVINAVNDAAQLVSSLGHEVEEVPPDWVDDDVAGHFLRVVQANAAYFSVAPTDEIEPLNRALLEWAEQTPSTEYVMSVAALQSYSRRVVAFWNDYDVVLTPTLGVPPVVVGWLFEEDDPLAQLQRSAQIVPYTAVVNITGQPAASVPLFWSDDGLPIGVQLIGRPADEATLLRLSAQLEEARPWAQRRPPLS
jgi:amidase